MRKILEISIETIGTCSNPEISPPEYHIEAKRTIVVDHGLDRLGDEVIGDSSPIEAPFCEPAAVDLAPE